MSKVWMAALGTVIIATFASSNVGAETIAPFQDNGLPGNGDFVVVADPASVLRSPKSVFIRGRKSTQLTVLWADRTDVETGYRVERADLGQVWARPLTGDWQTVRTIGPQSGFPQITDNGLTPEMHYCYRIIAVGENAEIPSLIRCGLTHAAQTQPVFRVQLRLTTADIPNAGTNDDIEVLLQHRAVIVPTGNSTWIDYSRNDFEPGDEFSYDLNFGDLKRISDITQLFVEKSGSDDWCVTKIELVVNMVTYFEHEFADESEGCFWLNADNDGLLVIPFEDLRGHALWGRFDPEVLAAVAALTMTTSIIENDDDPLPDGVLTTLILPSDLLGLTHKDMVSRVESIVGDMIATEDAHWQSPAPDKSTVVEVRRADEDSYWAFFHIIGEAPWGPQLEITEARITGRLALDISASCNPDTNRVRYSMVAHDLETNVDFAVFWLENNIEGKIEDQFSDVPIDRELRLTGLPDGVRCTAVPVTISDQGDVEIRLLLTKFFQVAVLDPDQPVVVVDPEDGEDSDDGAPDVGPVAIKEY